MRSKLMIAAAVATSMMLGVGVAAADSVQEQLRLMEQRMAEMEDRLEATSEKLKSAEATVEQQQAVLTEAGLAEDEDGVRSAAGEFFKMIDVSGLVAASYNYRILGVTDNNLAIGNSFRHRNADTFSLDQLWLTLDKPTNEESRAGFHGDLLYGESARAMRASRVGQPLGGFTPGDSSDQDFYLFSAYVSYLAPIGNGIRFDLGKRDTLMGIERIKTNINYNVTQGRVFQLIPIVNTGLVAQTDLTDQISFAAGVFNDVASDTSIDDSRNKAYFGQIAYNGDQFGFKVDTMVGKDSSSNLQNSDGEDCQSGNACKTAILDAVATAQLGDNLEAWAQFVWVRHFGNSIDRSGDTHAVATAARLHVTDATSFAGRFEYVNAENDYRVAEGVAIPDMEEVLTLTFTGAHKLTDDLTLRGEMRWDRNLGNNHAFAISNDGDGNFGSRSDQLLGIAELFYEF
ncbi:MAG: outer membrane beta-barrel protein [Myxococcota bacterium]